LSKVLFFTTRHGTGGAELNSLMLAEQLAQQGFQTEMWCLYRVGDLRDTSVPLRVFSAAPPRSPAAFFKMAWQFLKAVREERPVAAFGFQPLANILGSLAMFGLGPFVASQRNPSSSQRLIIRVAEAVVGSTPLYHSNVCVSHAVCDTYRRYPAAYRRRLVVIHNGLPPLPSSPLSKRQARDSLGLPVEASVVGYVARLHQQKNPLFLLQVMELMQDWHLVFVGDGPMEAEVRARAARFGGRVHFLGRLDGQDLVNAYRSFDVLAFPSLYEGFGRTLVEAMSLGVPVVANDIPITREVMGDAGRFAPLDPTVWANELANAAHMKDRTVLSSRAGSFSLSNMVSQYANQINRTAPSKDKTR